ncbi:MAG: universal stress protein [Geminicoccaceae bacterium]
MSTLPFDRIVHPTDLAEAGTPAFDHALRLAVAGKSHFYLVHAAHIGEDGDGDWDAFPGVRSTLRRWGMLPADAPPEAVSAQLGVRVTKAEVPDRDPIDRMVHFIDENRGNLVVLATHARDDASYWLRGSVAEKLARRAGLPTLFLPYGVPGFVAHDTGAVTLGNILLPADRTTPPGRAAMLALAMADALGCPDAVLHVLHVGSADEAPMLPVDDARLRRIVVDGSVVEQIGRQAEAVDADLVVMATHGPDGLADHLFGTTTEQALHKVQRPLLAVPVD